MRSEAAGDVGDLRVAGEISPAEMAPEPLLCELADWSFRCFLWRRLSSLWSFMRIDRLAGAISSEPCNDLERVWRPELPDAEWSSSLINRSKSDSDSEDIPDEDELEENLDAFADPRRPEALFPLLCSSNGFPTSMAEIPRACVIEALLGLVEKADPSFKICEKGAKFPLSSYRHAIKYTPGAAKVDSTQRIESKKLREVLGMMFQPADSELNCPAPSFSKRGVSSLAVSSFPFSASAISVAPPPFSLNISSLDPLLDSVTSAEDNILPYELDREGAGVCGGDTRAERMFKEFIVLSEPWRRTFEDFVDYVEKMPRYR
jgi:hypothetical protein